MRYVLSTFVVVPLLRWMKKIRIDMQTLFHGNQSDPG
jgi:hypothetical protein